MSYRVFWVEEGDLKSNEFARDELTKALKLCEELRLLQHSGYDVRHVVMSAENPDMVGKLGAVDPSPEVAAFWSKRRYVGPVGRPSGGQP